MNNFEDYFEPSKEELIISEIKDKLMNNIKEEIKNEIEQLKKENNELKEYRDNKEKMEREYQNKIRELEYEYQQKERTLMRKPIRELIEIVDKDYYCINYKYIKKEKCDKCDDKRKLHLIDCYGKEHLVNCVCDDSYKSKYKVDVKRIGVITELSIRNEKLSMWCDLRYKDSYKSDEEYIHGSYFDKESIIYDYDKFIKNFEFDSKCYFHNYLFANKEDAQKFADYVNEKVGE